MLYVEVDCFFYKMYMTPEQARRYGLSQPPRLVNLATLQKKRNEDILSFMRKWKTYDEFDKLQQERTRWDPR